MFSCRLANRGEILSDTDEGFEKEMELQSRQHICEQRIRDEPHQEGSRQLSIACVAHVSFVSSSISCVNAPFSSPFRPR